MTTHIPQYEPPLATPSIASDPNRNNRRSWPLLAALAVTLAIVGVVVAVALLLTDASADSLAVASPGESAASTDLAAGSSERSDSSTDETDRPEAGRDHWHAAYGVWSCATGDESGEWLPIFQGPFDPVGIHSHQDGVIHIHPFTEEAAGANAQLHHFVTSMEASLTDDSLTLPDGEVLRSGDDCGGEEAVLHLRKWQFDFLYEDGETPEVITEDLGAARFVNDREVWQIVHAPLDADLPELPAGRFSSLDAMAGQFMPVEPIVIEGTAGPDGELIIPDFITEGSSFTDLDDLVEGGELPDEIRELIEEHEAEHFHAAEPGE